MVSGIRSTLKWKKMTATSRTSSLRPPSDGVIVQVIVLEFLKRRIDEQRTTNKIISFQLRRRKAVLIEPSFRSLRFSTSDKRGRQSKEQIKRNQRDWKWSEMQQWPRFDRWSVSIFALKGKSTGTANFFLRVMSRSAAYLMYGWPKKERICSRVIT